MAGKSDQVKAISGENDNHFSNENLKVTRQEMIVREVLDRGTMTIAQLSDVFGVAEITIRRDLDELSETGYLERVWGGVRAKNSPLSEAPVIQRQKANMAEKHATRAGGRQRPDRRWGPYLPVHGDNHARTARVIAQKAWTNLQVVTNGLPIITELLRVPGIQLMCVGGLV